MKLRILLLSLLATYTIHLTAQELYSNDLSCVKADNNLAVITASGIAEKKKDVYSMALKSIFNALFLNGIDGVENGRPLVGKEDLLYEPVFQFTLYAFVKIMRRSKNRCDNLPDFIRVRLRPKFYWVHLKRI